ncbi:MAG: HAD-IA family hydrolase [Candidatus Cloacimonetes bacterium]|nr:HAD-IA family hydrolase [Candidatus Cloacimonadota bacterium]
MKPYLLFDFDGTIADSVKPFFVMLNEMAPSFGKDTVSWEEFEELRTMRIPDIIKRLKISKFQIARAMPKILSEYRKIVHDLDPYPGIKELFAGLDEAGISYALLSSNRDENLNYFLEQHGLKNFDWVEGTDGILAKKRSLARLIRKHKLDKSTLYYIGDETRDIEAARACGIRIICVSWGLHPRAHLQKHNPDFLVDTPAEILEIIGLAE